MKYLNYKIQETEDQIQVYWNISDEQLTDKKSDIEFCYEENDNQNFDWETDFYFIHQTTIRAEQKKGKDVYSTLLSDKKFILTYVIPFEEQ